MIEPTTSEYHNGTRTKKRKSDRPHDSSRIEADSNSTKIPKEERREAKRLKKLKSDGRNGGKDGDGNGQKADHDPEDDAMHITPEPKLSKEERKEAKRLKKLRKGTAENVQVIDEPIESMKTETADRVATKAERKAEKAQLKAMRKQEQAEPSESQGQTNNVSHSSKVGEAKSSTIAPLPNNYTEDPALASLPETTVNSFLTSNHIAIRDPSTTTSLRPIIDFSHLPTGVVSSNTTSPFSTFKTPTPIQAAAWPHLLSGRDVIGVAETGSGKTLAFGVPCIRSIVSSKSKSKGESAARAVIVSPTRELAVQIHSQIETLAKSASLHTVCVYGGVPKDPQRAALNTAHIVVATPGRLNDLINEGSADLSNVHYLVLDEADRMLDKGFEEEIRKIIATTKTKNRQTLMFTATWPPSVRDLASTFMDQPIHISIGADNPTGELRANKSIKQLVEVIDPRQKETRLLQLLQKHQSAKNKNDRILVFCLYKKEAARIEGFLRSRGLRVAGIHGDMSQVARSSSLDSFKSGDCPLLVATDVAARGLDIPAVKVVVNVTFPLTVEDYVHRIGRTGRAGAEGLAVTLFTEHDKAQSGGLINVLRAAGQDIPEDLLKFGTTVKKKEHEAYGAFYKDLGEGAKKEGTKIKFD